MMTANVSNVRAPIRDSFTAAIANDSKVNEKQARQLIDQAERLNKVDSSWRAPTPGDRGTKNLMRLYDQNVDSFDKQSSKLVADWLNLHVLAPILVMRRARAAHKISKEGT